MCRIFSRGFRPDNSRAVAWTDRQQSSPVNRLKSLTHVVVRSILTVAVLLAVSSVQTSFAEPTGTNTKTSAKSLDEQVQDIKTDVLAIAAELSNLEERLLYPSNTQLAVFVSLAEGQPLTLDSARITIDGELVSHHIYSFKELEALAKGGVQRIYTGNVQTGEHRLEVAISGTRSAGKSFESVESYAFRKDVDPKLVGITLAGEDSGSATIAIKDW